MDDDVPDELGIVPLGPAMRLRLGLGERDALSARSLCHLFAATCIPLSTISFRDAPLEALIAVN